MLENGPEDNRQVDTLRWMPFKNESSETVPAHAVMRITGTQKGSTSRSLLLKCDKPSTSFKRIYAVNGHSPVAAGRYGTCTYAFDGPVMVAYEGGTPAVDEGWGVKPGSWKINKNYPVGFTCQGYNNTEKSVTFAVQQPINTFIGKLNGTLSVGGSAAVSVWKGTANSESDETGLDVTCYDWLMKSGATAIASGKKVVVKWINGIWYIVEAECA